MDDNQQSRRKKAKFDDVNTRLRNYPESLPPLTPPQKDFALNGGPLVAGPGAGKTTTMVWALYFMLQNLNAHVYVLSFTKSACNEFAERIAKGWPGLEDYADWEVWCKEHLRTVHSLAAEICHSFNVRERRRSKMVATAFKLVKENRSVAEKMFRDWVIIADEGQDSEPVQLSLLAWMARFSARDALVGDPRQCIFQFAGCRPQQFHRYLNSREKTREVQENFRSSQEIVSFVNCLVETKYDLTSVNGDVLKTYLEGLAPQVSFKGPNGRKPIIVHITALCDHLSSVTNNINEYFENSIANPDYSSIACLVRGNSMMDKVHENLSLHPKSKIPCFSWCSQTKLGYVQKLPNMPSGSFVQILNVHQAKGQEFDFVLYLVQGYSFLFLVSILQILVNIKSDFYKFRYSKKEEADKAFEDINVDHLRTEELHLHIVAASRAIQELVIVIIGKVPPIYLEKAIQNADVIYKPPSDDFWTKPEDNVKPVPDSTVTSLARLLEKHAAEGLLHYISMGRAGSIQDPKDCDLYLAGFLVDERIPLKSGILPIPRNYARLCVHGLACHFNCVVLSAFQACLCGSTYLHQVAKDLINQYVKLPLREYKEGATLKAEMQQHSNEKLAELFANLIAALICYFESSTMEARHSLNLRLGLLFVDTKRYNIRNDAIKLRRCLEDLVYFDGHHGNYAMGTRGSSTMRLAAEQLKPYKTKESLLGMTCDEMYNQIFRDRTRFDYKTTMWIREELLVSSEKITQTNAAIDGVSLKNMGKMTFFNRIFRQDCERARSVSSLISRCQELKLNLDDFCLEFKSYAKVREQALDVRDVLAEHHSEEELSNMKLNVDFEHHVDERILKELGCDIYSITGTIDVFVSKNDRNDSSGGTVIIIKTKEDISLDDEVFTIASAAMYGADCALLVDSFRGQILSYKIDERKMPRQEIIKALLKGAMESEDETDLFDDPGAI